MDVMDASGSTGNDVSIGKDVSLHKVMIGFKVRSHPCLHAAAVHSQ
jgi:hypothetical protein